MKQYALRRELKAGLVQGHKKSVETSVVRSTSRGSRIAQIVETDNAESPRMAYINPMRE